MNEEQNLNEEPRGIELVKKTLAENKKGLWLGKVGQDHKRIFIEFADEHFHGDYGMTLQHFMDFFFQVNPQIENLQNEIFLLRQEILSIKQGPPVQPKIKKVIGPRTETGGI